MLTICQLSLQLWLLSCISQSLICNNKGIILLGAENQQTQPTYGVESGNRSWATLVESERSHHCAIPAPQLPHTVIIAKFLLIKHPNRKYYWPEKISIYSVVEDLRTGISYNREIFYANANLFISDIHQYEDLARTGLLF